MSKNTSADRYATINHVADKVIQEKELSVADFGVWAYFWRHGNIDGFVDLANSKIMQDLNIKDRKTLRKHIINLTDAGLIGVEQKGKKDRTPTKYWYRIKSKKTPKQCD